MQHDRNVSSQAAVVERRLTVAGVQRSATASRSPAQALQQRLGLRASRALIQRVSAQSASSSPLQFSNVSSPHDPAEREAEAMARKVVRMREPASVGGTTSQAATGSAQRKAMAAPSAAAPSALGSVSGIGSGAPLPASVRGFMEPRFGANFANVRVHTGEAAAQQSADLSAHAFTVGEHVVFGRDKFQPESAGGRELIAHELTHTIQQGAAVQRSADTAVSQHQAPSVQRWGIGDALTTIADKANYIPGFRLLTIVLGMHPVNMRPVERNAANMLRALLELIPVAGVLIAQALDNYGLLARVGGWVDLRVRSLGMVGAAFKGALDKFLGGLKWSDVFDLGGVWERAKRIFTEPIDRLLAFGLSLVSDIVQFVRTAILLPLAALAEGTRGYGLLKAVLGTDPVTGQAVPRTPEALIGGFMTFIGQEEVWENIKKANAVPRAWAWFQGALAGLTGFVKQIPGLFMNALKSLEIIDLLFVAKAFAKIANVFGGFIVHFVNWAGSAVWTLLELIFEVVSPATLVYLKKTGRAIKSILMNPLPFARNLVAAAKLGFMNFGDNFARHLKTGLIDWLTGSLEGVYIPKALTLPELGKFALSVLGITWAQIRGKIVKVLGPKGETIMQGLETGLDVVVALVTGGAAAVWEMVKDRLVNLKDQVIGGIVSFVTDTVVKKAIPKLVGMFIPGAGFISAIISIYDTIMVVVEKLSKIVQVVLAFIDSIVAIAAGNITTAAKRVENILGNLLSLSIGFLAGFLGLGKVTDKIKDVIEKVRVSVNKAIDAAIAWIVEKAKKLFAKGKAAVADWWKKSKPFRTKGGESHEITFVGDEKTAVPMVASKKKQTVPEHGAAFKKKASSPEATPEQQKNAALIDATIALAKTNPSDPALATDMKQLFECYDEGGAVKQAKITRVTGSIGNSTVGLAMTIENLNKKHPPGTPSSSSEQVSLMNQLVTEPKRSSESKFIRGHLLNENLGGPGVALNMFPITANANKNHLTYAESAVKKWVENPKNYVWYNVTVTGISANLNGKYKHPANYVNCVFVCSATLTKPDGTMESLNKTIPSEYQVKHTKETTEFNTKTN